MPFISSLPLGHFCVHSRSSPEMGSENYCLICRQSMAGERHERKITKLWKETKTDSLHCSYWQTLFLLGILGLLRNPVICKQTQLLQDRVCAECKEGGVCRQPTKVCHVASMHTKSSFLAPDSPPWQATFLYLMYFMSGSFSEVLSPMFLSSKYKAGVKFTIVIQSIGQCCIEITAYGITAWNFHQEHPSQGLWLFLHTLEKTGSFSTRLGKFL